MSCLRTNKNSKQTRSCFSPLESSRPRSISTTHRILLPFSPLLRSFVPFCVISHSYVMEIRRLQGGSPNSKRWRSSGGQAQVYQTQVRMHSTGSSCCGSLFGCCAWRSTNYRGLKTAYANLQGEISTATFPTDKRATFKANVFKQL